MKTKNLQIGLVILLSIITFNVKSMTFQDEDDKNKGELTEVTNEESEQEQRIEDWMLDLDLFLSNVEEEPIPLEKWMLSLDTWITEPEQKLESWMLTPIQSNNTACNVIEPSIELEDWMLN